MGSGVGHDNVGVGADGAAPAAACQTVTACPPIVMMAVRLEVEALARTWNATFPLPEPPVIDSVTQV